MSSAYHCQKFSTNGSESKGQRDCVISFINLTLMSNGFKKCSFSSRFPRGLSGLKHLDRIKSHKKKTYIAYHFVDVPCTSYVLNATTTMEVRQNAILNG